VGCLAEIDCGSSQAQSELLFLAELLFQLGDRIDPRTDFSGTLGFSDVYFCPAFGADNFIRLEKASVGLLKDLATLRRRALERVAHFVEMANRHEASPDEPISPSSYSIPLGEVGTAQSHDEKPTSALNGRNAA
jgi:hypothetical protein